MTKKTPVRQALPLVARRRLESSIRDGHYPVGSQLPPEERLAELLEVSRATLRDAIRALENDGYIQRRRGIGTFVLRAATLGNSLETNTGVTDLILRAGLTPGCSEIHIEAVEADSAISSRLNIQTGALLTRIVRVRTADGKPVVVSHDYLSPRLSLNIAALRRGRSLYESLEETGVGVHHGVAEIDAAAADSTLARQLNIGVGAPLLIMRQVDSNSVDEPILYADEWYVPNAFRMTAYRRGPSA